MIITCINCSKKFEVNADLIPSEGRNIQCGSCNHIWFFTKELDKLSEISDINETEDRLNRKNNNENVKKIKKLSEKIYKPNSDDKKNSELINYEQTIKFSFSDFLSYILLFIISFTGLIVLVDTFQSPLFNLYPSLELVLFNFYEVLKDVQLFIKDLF